MANYVYHSRDSDLDKFSKNFESRLGDSRSDHEADFFDIVRMIVSMKSQGSLLDIGAGLGRVVAASSELIAEVVALEPDQVRWSQCNKAYNNPPRCQIFCQTSGEYIQANPGKSFDVIVVSMVIQHISTRACQQLLEEAAQLLKPDGIAIIYTTHTLEETKGFSFSGDPSREVYVDKHQFDEYAEAPPSQQSKGLPVRRFSKSDLMEAVSAFFEPVYWRQTSYYKRASLGIFAKRLQVEPEKLKDTGNSQFVVVKNLHE